MFCVVTCECQFLIWFFQLNLKVVGNVLSMVITVLFIFSHRRFPIGWYGVVWDGLTPVISGKRLNIYCRIPFLGHVEYVSEIQNRENIY